jgi:glutathione reductase (NADPH)
VGDVIDRVALTPVALAEAMVVVARLFGKGERRDVLQNIPTAVFSHPNVGTVGLTEEEARKTWASKDLQDRLQAAQERRAIPTHLHEAGGRCQTDRCWGAHGGRRCRRGDPGFAVALQCGATKAQFDTTIGIHPTSAEEFVTMRTPVA